MKSASSLAKNSTAPGMSSKERIEQAKADWRAGRMKLPDLDNREFIPLPGEPAAPANPMS